MTRKIFSSILSVSVIVLLLCLISISGILYGYFGNVIKKELRTEADIMAQQIEDDDTYLQNMNCLLYTSGTREAVAIVPHGKKKIEAYRAEKKTVIFTRDTHGEDDLLTQEGRKLPVEHCIRGSHGWKISSKLDTADSEIIDKPTFGSYDLIERLEELDQEDALESVELVGLCLLYTSRCV